MMQETIDNYMATRGGQKSVASPNEDDDAQNVDDDEDDETTKAEYDEFKKWLDGANPSTPAEASDVPKPPARSEPMAPPPVPIKPVCKCKSNPCISTVLKVIVLFSMVYLYCMCKYYLNHCTEHHLS